MIADVMNFILKEFGLADKEPWFGFSKTMRLDLDSRR